MGQPSYGRGSCCISVDSKSYVEQLLTNFRGRISFISGENCQNYENKYSRWTLSASDKSQRSAIPRNMVILHIFRFEILLRTTFDWILVVVSLLVLEKIVRILKTSTMGYLCPLLTNPVGQPWKRIGLDCMYIYRFEMLCRTTFNSTFKVVFLLVLEKIAKILKTDIVVNSVNL